MIKSKKLTNQQKQVKKAEQEVKRSVAKKVVAILYFIVMFVGSLAISAYLLIMVDNPDMGQKVLGYFSLFSAVNYLTLVLVKAIK